MPRRRPSSVLVLSALALVTGCDRGQAKAEAEAGTVADAASSARAAAPPSSSAPPAASAAPGESAIEARARRVTEAWSRALDAHDEAALAKVYAARVELYGKEMSREEAIRAKRAAFGKTPTFTQSIHDLRVTPSSLEEGWVARFTKTSGAQGKTASVSALVALRSEGGSLRIWRESDAPTEAKRGGDLEECKKDADCRNGKLCVFVAGETWVCSAPPKPETCPKGQIFLPRVGGCWVPCTSDHDCEDGTWCRHDPNAPDPICMARL